MGVIRKRSVVASPPIDMARRAALPRMAFLSALATIQASAANSGAKTGGHHVFEPCRDNPTYESRIGMSCSDHIPLNCNGFREVGLDDDEVDELLQNCPQSCRVAPCRDGEAAELQWPDTRNSSRETAESVNKRRSSEQVQCFPGWDAGCQDNPLFRTSVGFQCAAHATLDCTKFQAIGFTEKQVFDIINNCPCSCKVECGTWTISPSAAPSFAPSISPHPSYTPTRSPSTPPSQTPTGVPTNAPSSIPTTKPSGKPSGPPSLSPSGTPTHVPSMLPSVPPSTAPTQAHSLSPSSSPSKMPSSLPSTLPSQSMAPSLAPSSMPTSQPSSQPSNVPSAPPTALPSYAPSLEPTAKPSLTPSVSPSSAPTSPPTPASSPMELVFSIPLELNTPTPFVDADGVRVLEDVLRNFLQFNQEPNTPVEIKVADVSLVAMTPRLTARKRSRLRETEDMETEEDPSETLSQVSAKVHIKCDVFPWEPHAVDPSFLFVPHLLNRFDVEFGHFLEYLSRSSDTFKAPSAMNSDISSFIASPRDDQSTAITSSNPSTFDTIQFVSYAVGGLAVGTLVFAFFVIVRRGICRGKNKEDNDMSGLDSDEPGDDEAVVVASPKICYPSPGTAMQVSPYNANDGLMQKNVATSETWQQRKQENASYRLQNHRKQHSTKRTKELQNVTASDEKASAHHRKQHSTKRTKEQIQHKPPGGKSQSKEKAIPTKYLRLSNSQSDKGIGCSDTPITDNTAPLQLDPPDPPSEKSIVPARSFMTRISM